MLKFLIFVNSSKTSIAMKMNISIGIMVCVFLLYSPLFLFGQENPSKFWQGWSINVNGGASLFYGDVENYDFYKVFDDLKTILD